ncbi:YheC/YheD family protein [Ammoniphilus sp. CFH 90114]|uniref:YheC/YheD family endospore coat-associated protein n=1 Tax=Ammoniphilus sp. CFH 90114 TaxID=2493665 RepID=UPI00100F33D5|nr:YheC/YheD family protein [Ammoniphilus sp. CFH 90114]RXT07179.1 YheC/YheD family protein [Ammoniphilus sp. CFH 90114]
MNKRVVIGVLTTPGNLDVFRPLFRENRRIEHLLFVFSLRDIHFKRRKIMGYALTEVGRWVKRSFDWPDLVIDKYFNVKSRLYKRIRKHSFLPFIEQELPGKWEIHHVLHDVRELRQHLPETRPYHRHTLRKMLRKFSLLYVKPMNGTWGRGIVRIERRRKGYLVVGQINRKRQIRRLLAKKEVFNWMDRWVDRSPFVIQQGLLLYLLPDRVADLRVLIQKNERGYWQITGEAMRIGARQIPVSNLHGGGSGKECSAVLRPLFGKKKGKRILLKCHELSHLVARTIEENYGKMMELGLDFGIDIHGDIWIIEANDKPGRKIFRQIGRLDLFKLANRQALRYASYLMRTSR